MPGSIVLRPIEANLTHNTELIGKMDPYVQVIMDGHKLRTHVCRKGGKHPMWDDSITIPSSTGNGLILVEVKDKDLLHDDRIGSFELDLREVETQGTLKKWFPLLHKEKPAGEILLEAVFSSGTGFVGQTGYGGLNNGLVGGGLIAPTMTNTQYLPGQAGYIQPGYGQAGYTPAPYTAPLQGPGLQTQGATPNPGYKSLSEQFAEEALLRGIDPLHSHSVYQNHSYPTGTGAMDLNNSLIHKDRNLLPGQGNLAGGLLPGQQGLVGNSGYIGQQGLIGNSGLLGQQGVSNVPLGQAGLLPADAGFVGGSNYGNQIGTGLNNSSNHTVKNQHSIPMQHSNFTPVGTGLGSDYLVNNVIKTGPTGEVGHHGQYGTVVKEGLNPTTQGPKGTANLETYDRKIQNL